MVCCCYSILIIIGFLVAIWKFIQRRWLLPQSIFCNKYVLITGCDSGFGRALALNLDSLGVHVIAACITDEGCRELDKITSNRMSTLKLDITSGKNIREVREKVEKLLPDKNKGLWGLVNNAGIWLSVCPFLSRMEEYRKTFDVNYFGLVEMNEVFLPLIMKSGGRIVNVASAGGRWSFTGGPYISSKFAVEGYTDELRKYAKTCGVSVHTIEPGYFRTTNIANSDASLRNLETQWQKLTEEERDFYGQDFLSKNKDQFRDEFEKPLPLSKYNKIEDVVAAMTHAVIARYPKTRYVVGLDAKLFYIPLSLLPDWIGDRLSFSV